MTGKRLPSKHEGTSGFDVLHCIGWRAPSLHRNRYDSLEML